MNVSAGMATFFRLLWGTVIHRPYVYGFFACFLVFALRHLRWKATLAYLVMAYLIAFGCEFSSTRWGFPFGMYVYLDSTRTRELWISNVPFWDSLSFVFLSYFSWLVATGLRGGTDSLRTLLQPATAFLAGRLMMMLDVVIDPLTLRGDEWFLGRIYYYPDGGTYFGVTLANFAGWLFVGSATILAFQALANRGWLDSRGWGPLSQRTFWGAFGVYAGVFVFNLAITAWIRHWDLFLASSAVVALTLAPSFALLKGRLIS